MKKFKGTGISDDLKDIPDYLVSDRSWIDIGSTLTGPMRRVSCSSIFVEKNTDQGKNETLFNARLVDEMDAEAAYVVSVGIEKAEELMIGVLEDNIQFQPTAVPTLQPTSVPSLVPTSLPTSRPTARSYLRTSIETIQTVPSNAGASECFPSPMEGEHVNVSGIVTAVIHDGPNRGFFMQDASGSLFSGIRVNTGLCEFEFDCIDDDGSGVAVFCSIDRGEAELVSVLGTIVEVNGTTQIASVSEIQRVVNTSIPEPTVVNTGDLGELLECERGNEGMLVKIANATSVADVDDGQLALDDGSGTVMLADGLFEATTYLVDSYGDDLFDSFFTFVVGVAAWQQGSNSKGDSWEVNPRAQSDILNTDTFLPTMLPTTPAPSVSPVPTYGPTGVPTPAPTLSPTAAPTLLPSLAPTNLPTSVPIRASFAYNHSCADRTFVRVDMAIDFTAAKPTDSDAATLQSAIATQLGLTTAEIKGFTLTSSMNRRLLVEAQMWKAQAT